MVPPNRSRTLEQQRGKLLESAKGGGRGAVGPPGETTAKERVARTMSRGRVAICALIAMFAFAALAAPALAKKENESYFEASGETKLSVTGGKQEIFIPFGERGSIKITCQGVSGTRGLIVPTEGKATSFTMKVKYESCGIRGKKKSTVVVTMSEPEYEFHSNGTLSILNEVKIEYEPKCKFVMDSGQTVGAEEVEEDKPRSCHLQGARQPGKSAGRPDRSQNKDPYPRIR